MEAELTPESHKDYIEVFDKTFDDISIQCVYNNIYGAKKFEATGEFTFWPTFLISAGNSDMEVGVRV